MSFRILVIEDSKTQLLAIKHCLENEGYNVITADSGAMGIAKAFKEKPHLIISDVIMSGINGYQLCRLIRNEAELCDIPVILLTKLDASLDKFWGLKSGANFYVPKEPGFPTLIKICRETLEDIPNLPKFKVISDSNDLMSVEEVNSRLIKILENLLFEATIIDEVRKIGEDILDINIMSHKLFNLLTSIYDYKAFAIVVNQPKSSLLIAKAQNDNDYITIQNMAINISNQLGLTPIHHDVEVNHEVLTNTITIPVDILGMRLGVLIISTHTQLKPADEKLFKLIAEQFSIILRLYHEHIQKFSVTSK